TLLYPKFKEGESVKQFDIVVANPPWNQDGYDEIQLKKESSPSSAFSMDLEIASPLTGRGSSTCSLHQKMEADVSGL
ncbi:MAG: N-6 DNA methylase, partial [Methanoregula sp.]